jgi:uncharacterized protein
LRRVSKLEAARFLCAKLGLTGPLWSAEEAPERMADLAMLQIDSIIVTGLRNHELAWLARAHGSPRDYYAAVHDRRLFIETHHPVHAVRRDLVPELIGAFASRPKPKAREARRLAPVAEKVRAALDAGQGVRSRELEAKRIVGGFATIKATTRVLEDMFYLGEVQIAGRSPTFERIFDFTHRVAPEIADRVASGKPDRAAYGRFLAASALDVLKLATEDQLARRAHHHAGPWRAGGPIAAVRAATKAYLGSGAAQPVAIVDDEGETVYWHKACDTDGWEAAASPAGERVRIVPPLDNLLFNRPRVKHLFGLDYLFEAYKPVTQRRFYFGMPIVEGGRIVGVIDAKLAGEAWTVRDASVLGPVDTDELRAAIHRLAAAAGAKRVAVGRKIPADWRKAIAGKII